MPKDPSRSRKVSEQIKRELAVLINTEVKDPRVSMLTISAVKVTPDLSQAKIYITSLEENTDKKQLIKVLESMSGYLRSELGRQVSLRIIPKLIFIYDVSVERGAEISKLIDSAVAEDRQKAQSNGTVISDSNSSDVNKQVDGKD